MRAGGPYIHSSAIVEDGAVIGDGTRVWHHCHVRSGARVGEYTTLGKNVFVDSGARLGNRVKVQNNVSVYAGVTIEDEVFVGPSAVFTNDLLPRAVNADWEIIPTLVCFGSSIGANATIICGNHVGRFAMVGAGSVVTRPVRPHELVVGNPARHIGWVDAAGQIVSRDVERPGHLGRDR